MRAISNFSSTVILMKQGNKDFFPCKFPGSHFLPVLRDISERGRDLESIITQYITFVKPACEEFCLPVSDILHAPLDTVCVPEH